MGHNLQYLQYPDAFVDVGHVPPSLRATTKHTRMNKKKCSATRKLRQARGPKRRRRFSAMCPHITQNFGQNTAKKKIDKKKVWFDINYTKTNE